MFRHYGKQIGAVVCKQLGSESTKCGGKGGGVKIRMQPKKKSNSYSVDWIVRHIYKDTYILFLKSKKNEISSFFVCKIVECLYESTNSTEDSIEITWLWQYLYLNGVLCDFILHLYIRDKNIISKISIKINKPSLK